MAAEFHVEHIEQAGPFAPGPPPRNPAAHLGPYQWKKGQSGNPGGKPKEALTGKFPFAKEVLDRAEGKVGEKAEVTVKQSWREACANIPDEDLMELAAEQGRLDLLPRNLRERAEKMVEQGTLRLGERRD